MVKVGLAPNLVELGPFVIAWHSIVSAAAVVLAVYLIDRWGRRNGLPEGMITSIAIWAVLGGIVGARLVYVLDNWSFFATNLGQILAINEGGIAIYGGLAGGVAAGAAYSAIKRFPVRYLLDLSAPALILTQGLGRIGDLINGEHLSRSTELPWGVVYTHPDSPAYGMPAQHPAVGYEMLADFALFCVLWLLRGRLAPRGSLFAVYAALYAAIRLVLSFLRLDSNSSALGLNQQAWISLIVLVAALAVLGWLRPRLGVRDMAPPVPPREPRARRRRQ